MKKALVVSLILTNLFAFKVTNYKPIKGCILAEDNSTKVAIREFRVKDKKYHLLVDPNSLKTTIVNATNLYSCPKDINNTRYYRLLEASISNPKHPLENDGITSANSGIYLTTDLCPSSKRGFEEELYKSVIEKFPNPVPITLFITKKWIYKHKKEFNQLKRWQKEKKLDIIWGNHTANHIYHKNLPLNKNFVLSKEENLPKDILELEAYLIENGVTPSIFFRFPGLVSNKKAIMQVANFGLITIGSDTWLAIGGELKDGSIILLHGNKNEPKGIKIFLKLLNKGKIERLDTLNNIDLPSKQILE